MIRVVIFDWDGTLVDSESHIVSSITRASEAMNLPPLSYDRKKQIIGLGMREALLELYPGLKEAEIEQMRQHYSGHFFSRATNSLDLFPGVFDTLSELRRRGFNMAVATGKSRNGLSKALKSSGLGPFFDIERCADETRSKPDPQMLKEIADFYSLDFNEMLMVGDTTYDLQMANAVGMPSVAVSYGVHAVEDLEGHAPLHIIDALPELLKTDYLNNKTGE